MSFSSFFAGSSFSFHSLLLDSDEALWSSGNNEFGQLGLGDTQFRNKLEKLSKISKVSSVSSGKDHSICLTDDGRIWSFGSNSNGQTGLEYETHEPQELSMLNNISLISCGEYHSVCVDDQGFVWSFGRNYTGQLGHGDVDVEQINIPEQVKGLKNIVQVSCGGEHTLCLDLQNSLWSFGRNDNGQLGIGNYEDQYQPVLLAGFNHSIIQISCGGRHSIILDDQRSVWSFGWNEYGQLGHEGDENHIKPDWIAELKNIQQISCGFFITMCLDNQHNVWSFGLNSYGQLGHGDTIQRNKPTQISGLKEIVQISCGYYHTICLDLDGYFWSFGNNRYGQLGFGDYNQRNLPEKIQGVCGKIPTQKKRIKSAMSIVSDH